MMTDTNINMNTNNNQPRNPAASPTGWVKINLEYFTTIPGILKIVQFVLGILCMALASPARNGYTGFFLFVVIISFIATVLWSAAYFLGILENFRMPFNWTLTELINTGTETVLYFIAFILQLAKSSYGISSVLAGVLGIVNFVAYAGGTYFLFIEHRQSSPH